MVLTSHSVSSKASGLPVIEGSEWLEMVPRERQSPLNFLRASDGKPGFFLKRNFKNRTAKIQCKFCPETQGTSAFSKFLTKNIDKKLGLCFILALLLKKIPHQL